jgi:hypothetical protein
MSMPRDDSSSQRSPNRGCARFIGRVGALAVALGLGIAIANSAGIALADGTESGPSSGPAASAASTGSSGSSESQSTKGSTRGAADGNAADETVSGSTSTPPKPGPKSNKKSDVKPHPDTPERDIAAPTANGDATDVEPAVTDGTAATTPPTPATTEPSAADPKPKKPSVQPAPTVTKPDATVAADAPADPKPADVGQLRQPKVASVVPAETGGSQSAQAQPQPYAMAAVVDTVPTVAEAPVAPASPATGPVGFVTGLVSGLLSTLGLNPQAATGPVTPPEAPTLWTLLGWVRREIGQVFNPVSASTGVATMSTSLVEPTAAIAATSPLGTQQQLDAEALAAQTANTLPVQLMKLVLQFSFLGAASQLFAGVGGVDQQNLNQLSAAVNEYAMGAAFQQQILNSNEPAVVMQVAPPHTWYGLDVPGSRILYDNPDTIYRFMGVNAASTYVIRGQFTDPVPAETTFSVLTGLSGNTTQVLSGRDLAINPDGTFTITVSSAPAAPGEKNHLQLPNDATLIAARNTLSDWNDQQPMTLSIERASGPPNSLFSQLGGFAIPFIGPLVVSNPLLTTLVSLIPPLPYVPPILRGAVTAVIMALGIQREAQYMAVATTDPQTGQRIGANVLKNPTSNAEFLATQLQSAGYFQLADDQALVVTIDPGDAGYFVVPVTNDWTITDNYWDQQTSLNIAQAVKNADNKTYTIVISPTDPGVTNWVSTGGLNQGTISIRFQDLPVNPTNLPTVTSGVVNIDQLPADIPRITPADRALQLAARKAGYDNRFAPFPQP